MSHHIPPGKHSQLKRPKALLDHYILFLNTVLTVNQVFLLELNEIVLQIEVKPGIFTFHGSLEAPKPIFIVGLDWMVPIG